MCCLHQRRTLDSTLLLDRQVIVSEDQLADSQVWRVEDMACQDRWWVEDIAHEDVRDWCDEVQDWENRKFQVQLLALECKQVEAL
ncbi:hypothetical protein Y1Q_0022192 [Alligator mississippiensis]|uniref:Uncharacterized protein n=1 Tax=Alligator mississippiensis TaxID=8496 RepID=A0A151NZL5_ALLMI|nr:hypothetical protein Y1Q_0022192 [Alligator mississippiensis]